MNSSFRLHAALALAVCFLDLIRPLSACNDGGGGDPPSNSPPNPWISVDGAGYGATLFHPAGNPVTVTVHYGANDPDGNLSGIRYNIWNSDTGYFDNGGGGFIGQSGGSGEVDQTFNLGDGTWYFWTDAVDDQGAYNSTGPWTSGYVIHVITNSSPQTNWISATNTSLGASVTITGNATDPDGNLSLFHFWVSGPNMPGWNYIGDVSVGGGNATASINWTPPYPGNWAAHFRAVDSDSVSDANGNCVTGFTVFDQITTTISVSSGSPCLNHDFTVTAYTDARGANMTSQAIDYSTDGGNTWVSGSLGAGTRWEGYAPNNTLTATFNFSSPQTVLFRARGQSEYGPLSNFVYVTANVSNYPPQTNWVVATDTLAGHTTTFTANATDPDNNLDHFDFFVTGPGIPAWTYVGTASASGGNATVSFNWVPPTPGSYGVHFRAYDQYGAVDWNANVLNGFAVGTDISIAPAANQSILFGQTVVYSSTVTIPSGNIVTHNFDWAAPDGTWRWDMGNQGNVSGQDPENHFAPTTSDSRSYAFTPVPPSGKSVIGNWTVRWASDDTDSGWAWSSSYTLTVSKTTPSVSNWSDRSIPGTYTVQSADLSAIFFNPYNSSVPQPTGSVAYSIVSGGSGTISAGSSLSPGTYTIRASYPGDANYNATTADIVWTINPNHPPTDTLTINGATATDSGSASITTSMGDRLSLTASSLDNDGNLRAVNLWVKTPSTDWRNINASDAVADNTENSSGPDNAINSGGANVYNLTTTRHYTISSGYGTYQFRSRGIDSFGATNSNYAVITITVAASPLTTWLSASTATLNAGQTVHLTATTLDPDGHLVSQAIDRLPPGADPNTGWVSTTSWSGGPLGSDVLTYNFTPSSSQQGVWVFRARGANSSGNTSNYSYASVNVVNLSSQPDSGNLQIKIDAPASP